MSNIVLIYNSKTGFTKKYAEWIREEMPCDLVPYEKRKTVDFHTYDTVIYGGGFHAGFINGLKWFKKMMILLEGKKIVVFGTGASPAGSPEIETAFKQNFTEEEWGKVQTFYFQSGLCYEKMGVGDKMFMAMFRTMLKKTQADSEMCKAVQQSYDISRKEDIEPLVAYCLTNSKEENNKAEL